MQRDTLETTDADITPDGLSELLDYPEESPQEGETLEGEAGFEGEEAEEEGSPKGGEAADVQKGSDAGGTSPSGGDLTYIKLLEERLARLEAVTKPPATVPPPEEFDPLGDVDFDEAMTSREVFQGILKKVIQQTRESVLAELSPIREDMDKRKQAEVQKAADSFYQENPDLAGFKRTVVSAVQEVLAENPHMQQGEVLKKAATLARTALGLPTEVVRKEKKASPAFGTHKGVRTGKGKEPELSEMEKQILDLIL